MTPTVSRLILALTVITGTPVFYFILLVLLTEVAGWHSFTAMTLLTSLITGPVMVVGWVAVWYGEISWTPQRMLLTMLSPVVTGVAALFAGLLLAIVGGEIGAIGGTMVWAILWLGSTVFIWRESASERRKRLAKLGFGAIACPNCSNNMTGLREATCVQCGSQFTLDQLFASVAHARTDADVV